MENIKNWLQNINTPTIPSGNGQASDWDLKSRIEQLENAMRQVNAVVNEHGGDISAILTDLMNQNNALRYAQGVLENHQISIDNALRVIQTQQRDIGIAVAKSNDAITKAAAAFSETTNLVNDLKANFDAFKGSIVKTYNDANRDASVLSAELTNLGRKFQDLAGATEAIWNNITGLYNAIDTVRGGMYSIYSALSSTKNNIVAAGTNLINAYNRIVNVSSWNTSTINDTFNYLKKAGGQISEIGSFMTTGYNGAYSAYSGALAFRDQLGGLRNNLSNLKTSASNIWSSSMAVAGATNVTWMNFIENLDGVKDTLLLPP